MTVVSSEVSRSVVQRALPPAVLVVLMWASEMVDTVMRGALDQFGIQPRHIDSLLGIFAAPLLHSGFGHLMANTATFLVLGLMVALLTRHFWAVTLGVTILGGLAVWLVGAPGTVHIGASGLVYGYAAFLVVYGFAARRALAVVASLIVVAVYGSIVVGVLPTDPSISWEGHLFGALAGVLLAIRLGRRDRVSAPSSIPIPGSSDPRFV